MNNPFNSMDDANDREIIDISSRSRSRPTKGFGGRTKWIVGILLIALFFGLSPLVSIYVDSLWYDSLGFSDVFWYTLKTRLLLFLIFALVTAIILQPVFMLLEYFFGSSGRGLRTFVINNQPVVFAPSRLLRPISWIITVLVSIFTGLGFSNNWQKFALYLRQPASDLYDPIFNRSLSYYLFTLPVYQDIAGLLTFLVFIIAIATAIYILLEVSSGTNSTRSRVFTVASFVVAALLLVFTWNIYLSRFSYLWAEHPIFTGVNYMEANYLLPALRLVMVTLIIAAVALIVNALTVRRLLLSIVIIGLPVIIYIVGVGVIPSYVTNFIVKPNELDRETPYIEQNIWWTRAAYGLNKIEVRDYEASPTTAGLAIEKNRQTIEDIRLWDWRALQDTLRQVQEIRTYYDFPDVDVDRYVIGNEPRLMMIAAREVDISKLPESSRNWVNERLIYTHGYGVTMNSANGFTPEGRPQFLLSNMPIETTTPEITVTRPQIYFGQKTNSNIYVNTKQKEFDYPQGDANAYTVYEGRDGIQISGIVRRLALGWELSDISKLPFSDDVTETSRALLYRNILTRIKKLAPFLTYDPDPYIVVGNDGHLYWLIDGFTSTENYPYSAYYRGTGESLNYLRNSVKVVVDAYDGTVNFYVFEKEDPIINAYRGIFPTLFHDSSEMPAPLRAHIRYPETLIRAQADIYGLYHTQNAKVFFQREDAWSVARQVAQNRAQDAENTVPFDPYFVLTKLPGEESQSEFIAVMPFTPARRNNMIGWIAGRSDADAYGKLLVFNFPKSRLVDGPVQIEARVDQDARLSSQLTLWNQQGSRVQRGNLLVIPIEQGLLYVQPIYLQAERSPMPELRIVVLATQDKLVYGTTFKEALSALFGGTLNDRGQTTAQAGTQTGVNGQESSTQQPQTSTQSQTALVSVQQLIDSAAEDLAAYQRLTSEGKLGEAGQRLESLRQKLLELQRMGVQK